MACDRCLDYSNLFCLHHGRGSYWSERNKAHRQRPLCTVDLSPYLEIVYTALAPQPLLHLAQEV